MKTDLIAIVDMIDPVIKLLTNPTTWSTLVGIGTAIFAGVKVAKNKNTITVKHETDVLYLNDQIQTLQLAIATLISNQEIITKNFRIQIAMLERDCLALKTEADQLRLIAKKDIII